MDTNKLLKYSVLIIMILIILRCLYVYLNESHENFISDNDLVQDLLLDKTKSIINLKANDKTENDKTENAIYPWSTKLFNMQNVLQKQVKPIALYKPNLLINSTQYCKLGDMISQNTDYSPPSANEFSLLIKSFGSDIKPPDSFDLVVDFGNNNINAAYYDIDKYFNDPISFKNIASSTNNCASAFINLNAIIKNNLSSIKSNIAVDIIPNIKYDVGDTYKNNSINIKNIDTTNIVSTGIIHSTTVKLPAGIIGHFTDLVTDQNSKIISPNATNFSIPSSLDYGQPNYSDNTVKQTAFDSLGSPFNIIDITNTNINTKLNKSSITSQSIISNKYLFQYVPIIQLITYLQKLCNDIKIIYNSKDSKGKSNSIFTNSLNLVDSPDNLIKISNALESLSYDIINTDINDNYFPSNSTNVFSDKNMKILYDYAFPNPPLIQKPSLLKLVLQIIFSMKVNYNLTYVAFTPSNIGLKTSQNSLSSSVNMVLTGFNNDFISNIPSRVYNIMDSNNYDPLSTIVTDIKSASKVFNSLFSFSNELNNNNITFFPLKIYRPIPPANYVSLGHVFCNQVSQLQNIIDDKHIACVPSQCVKEIRDWVSNDKVFEYNDINNNIYWALYFNPYTGTFISTTKKQVPEGKVSKVVACVAKCTVVEDLKKADECTRKYYNLNKENSVVSGNASTNLASDQEEEFYLNKVKANSDSIAKLKYRSQQMQVDIDKATIVNREMNKNTLQNYVDTQKRNIDIILQKIIEDKNKIKTNINVNLNTLNTVIKMIKTSPNIPESDKANLVSKIINSQTMLDNNIITEPEYIENLNTILNSCPEYDLTGLVKKSMVTDVCYGCDI